MLELANVLRVTAGATGVSQVFGACWLFKLMQVEIEQTSWSVTGRLSAKTDVNSFTEREKGSVLFDQRLQLRARLLEVNIWIWALIILLGILNLKKVLRRLTIGFLILAFLHALRSDLVCAWITDEAPLVKIDFWLHILVRYLKIPSAEGDHLLACLKLFPALS